MFQPVKQARLADVIADQLRGLILEGTLKPGSRLPTERELSEQFQTSRPTIREAVARLEKEGLLQMQRGGMHVADPTEKTIGEPLSTLLMSDPQGFEDYMEFRQIIEGSAAYFAAMRANEVDRDILRQRYDRMVELHQTEDIAAEGEADADFHLAIYEASHNATLLHVMRALSEILRRDVMQNRVRLNSRHGYRAITLKQHQAIFDAIMGGAPEEARHAAQTHVSFAREAVAELRKAEARLEVSLRRLGAQVRPYTQAG